MRTHFIFLILKSMKKSIFLMLCMLVSLCGYAQKTVKGTVVDKADIPVIFSSDAHIKHQLIQHFAEEQRRLAEPLAKMRYISKSDELRQFLQSRHGPRTK